MRIVSPDGGARLRRRRPGRALLFTLPEREVLLGRSDGSGTAVMSESGEPESPLVARKSSSCRSRSLTRLRLQTDSCTSPPIPDCGHGSPGNPPIRSPGAPGLCPSHRRGDGLRACQGPRRDKKGQWTPPRSFSSGGPGISRLARSRSSQALRHSRSPNSALAGRVVARQECRPSGAPGRSRLLVGVQQAPFARLGGATLYVATDAGEVLRFPDVAARLAAE
jgi:hypothetical protein